MMLMGHLRSSNMNGFALIFTLLLSLHLVMKGASALINGEPTKWLFDDSNKKHDTNDDDNGTDTYKWSCISQRDQEDSDDDSLYYCPFVFKKPHQAVRTDNGEFKVTILEEEHLMQRRRMAVGLLTLLPNTLLLPHYVNGPSVFYVHRGQAHLSYSAMHHGMKEKTKVLSAGELLAIPAGTPLYVFNAQNNQNLQIISVVDLSALPKHITLECFYVAGGTYPTTVMSGFSDEVLAAAFKVSPDEIRDFLSSQEEGPFVNATKLQLAGLASVTSSSSLGRSLIDIDWTIFKKKEHHYRLLDDKHMFSNQNGWSVSINKKQYKDLEEADVGMFAVGLKSGCMVAPHWNPLMTLMGIVTHGRGYIQVVHANGSTLVDMDVEPSTVFVVPRYHPASQIAANDSDFEFVGFTTSSHPMRPYFLSGSNSVIKSLDESIISTSFNLTKDYISKILGAQPDSVLLTTETSNWWNSAA